jgi:uncharacterized membrane protein
VGFKRHIFSTLISLHSLLLCGAIFGYFYAWICPTPWGLDQIDPNTAITAMQAMNASVRNVVFAPVFFATPVVLLASALLAFGCGNRRAAWFYHGRSDLRVWWNGADHGHKRPLEPSPCVDRNAVGPGAGQRGPECHSETWQFWNIIRLATAVALLLTGLGLLKLTQTGRDSVNA